MSESKEEYPLKAKHVQELIADAYKEGQEEYKNSVSVQLLELPEQIKKQSLKVAELTNKSEALRLYLDIKKNEALELVMCATEDGKSKYTNDKARNIAVKQSLKDDDAYHENLDELSRCECSRIKEQIQYEYLKNMFTAYCSIAGMNGGK